MITIRQFRSTDISLKYLSWINDPEVTKYMTTKRATKEDLQHYYNFMHNSSRHRLFALINDAGCHVGNITLNNIKNGEADTGIMIGREYWGKGYATEAMKELLKYAFGILNLHRVWLGVEAENKAAIKVYIKTGFKYKAHIMEIVNP